MEGMGVFVIALIAALLVVVIIRLLARMKNPLGRVCRWYWNTNFKVASFIPFMGWMAHFIIAETEQEKKAKEKYVDIGKSTDDFGTDMVMDAAGYTKVKTTSIEINFDQQQKQKEELEEDLRGRAYRKYGTRDVQLNSDGSRVKMGDGEYETIEEFKRNMR